MSNQKIRSSNIEILRIISILMITATHVASQIGTDGTSAFSGQNLSYYFMHLGGEFGVMCFVLITGYFTCTAKFKIEKLLKIVFEVVFYSALGYIISMFLFHKELGFNLIRSFFPITQNYNWFPTAYILLYIFSPFINKFIETIDEKQHLKLLLIIFFVLAVVPNVLNIFMLRQTRNSFFDGRDRFSALFTLTFIYLIGAYIRKYPKAFYKNKKLTFSTGLMIYLAAFLSEIMILFVSKSHAKLIDYVEYFRDMNSVPLIIASVFTFLFFKELNVKNSKLINTFAASTLSVYLIHCNYFIGPQLIVWTLSLCSFNGQLQSSLLIGILTSVILFIGSVAIDYARIHLLEKPLFKLAGRCIEKTCSKAEKAFDWLFKKIEK